ncbi:MAG: hypothetical protein JXB33_09140 [Clostridia bacterium]|nr:hypothetical protein [Clostridia bacterium]
MNISTSSEKINRAVDIALKDIDVNIKPFRSGLLLDEKPVLLAGADYDRPWTRDTSINTYNFMAFYNREVARNTLVSVLRSKADGLYVGGQYWDSIIWALGAESYIDITGDGEFTDTAIEAIKNSLAYFEKNEYSSDIGLFRGPAVYGDGVSAYPDEYGISGRSGSILDWPKANPARAIKTGYGIPMHTLSTNCAYYNAYMMVSRLTGEKGYLIKAGRLKNSILENFHDKGKLKYITGAFGDHYEQEGLGIALGLLFGVLPGCVLDTVISTKNGIPCVHPPYARYVSGSDMGRHSGTVWPFINCLYAVEALKRHRNHTFDFEFFKLADNAIRDGQFYEIYHPKTGMPYGGLQESHRSEGFSMLKSCEHQAWNATGFMSMILHGIAGIRISGLGMSLDPYLPPGVGIVKIDGLRYRNAELSINIEGAGRIPRNVSVNGKKQHTACIDIEARGDISIDIMMREI